MAASSTTATLSLKVVVAGKTYPVEISASSTVKELKTQLETATGAPTSTQRILHKGKERADDERLDSAGFQQGAKVMLLFRPGFDASSIRAPPSGASDGAGAATADVGAGSAEGAAGSVAHPSDVPAVEAAGPAADTLEEDDGEGMSVKVVGGGQTHSVRVPNDSTLRDLKLRLSGLTGATREQQKLIFKGKERDDDEPLAAAGVADGAKLMLLFRESYHREADGARVVRDASLQLVELERRTRALVKKQQHRIADSSEMLAALGALDADVQGMLLDLENARLSAAGALHRTELQTRLRRLVDDIDRVRKSVRL